MYVLTCRRETNNVSSFFLAILKVHVNILDKVGYS